MGELEAFASVGNFTCSFQSNQGWVVALSAACGVPTCTTVGIQVAYYGELNGAL